MSLSDIGNWIEAETNAVFGWFSAEDMALINLFKPLMGQLKGVVMQLGQEDFQAGLTVLEQAAMAAVLAAATAAPGTQVAVAEAAFLTAASSLGITAVHNAEAGLIKALVAFFQNGLLQPPANSALSAVNTAPISANVAVKP